MEVIKDEIDAYVNPEGSILLPMINVAGGWVFYQNSPEEFTKEYYRIKTDGTEKHFIGKDELY